MINKFTIKIKSLNECSIEPYTISERELRGHFRIDHKTATDLLTVTTLAPAVTEPFTVTSLAPHYNDVADSFTMTSLPPLL